jgi:hypothetical protein
MMKQNEGNLFFHIVLAMANIVDEISQSRDLKLMEDFDSNSIMEMEYLTSIRSDIGDGVRVSHFQCYLFGSKIKYERITQRHPVCFPAFIQIE